MIFRCFQIWWKTYTTRILRNSKQWPTPPSKTMVWFTPLIAEFLTFIDSFHRDFYFYNKLKCNFLFSSKIGWKLNVRNRTNCLFLTVKNYLYNLIVYVNLTKTTEFAQNCFYLNVWFVSGSLIHRITSLLYQYQP